MKILYIIESLRSGGKERRLVELIKGLYKTNEIELVLLKPDVHYIEIDLFNIKLHNFARDFRKDYKVFVKFNNILKTFKPEIVHCWDNIAALHYGPICKINRIPFINSMISSAPPNLSYFSKRYLSNSISYPFSDIVLSNSNAGLLSFHVPKNKSRVIHNGFDMTRLNVKKSKPAIRSKFNIVTDKVVGMTASFSNMKDYFTFVKAAEMILKCRKDITFLAIGSGPNLEQVKNSISLEYIQFFRFLGIQKDVDSIVNIFDIGILSTFTEGVSNSIMEYMALSKPVIATDGGGTKELLLDNETGFLIEQQNAEQLAGKITFLLDHPHESKMMGEKGKKRIEDHFSITKMVNETLQLYKSQIK